MDTQQEVAVVVVPRKRKRKRRKQKPRQAPRYHVILWDDNEHTYDYVIRMLMELFAKSAEGAYLIAVEVDSTGKAVVETTHRERAELKRDQIHAFGKDPRIQSCAGSMWATIEAEHSD